MPDDDKTQPHLQQPAGGDNNKQSTAAYIGSFLKEFFIELFKDEETARDWNQRIGNFFTYGLLSNDNDNTVKFNKWLSKKIFGEDSTEIKVNFFGDRDAPKIRVVKNGQPTEYTPQQLTNSLDDNKKQELMNDFDNAQNKAAKLPQQPRIEGLQQSQTNTLMPPNIQKNREAKQTEQINKR